MKAAALALFALALGSACTRHDPTAEGMAIDSGVMTRSATSAAPSGSACTGPVFTFGDEDRLGWAAVGPLRFEGGAFAVDLGMELEFRSKKYGSAKGSRVALACMTCGPEDWKAFDGTLGKLVGKRVRAKGLVAPAWHDGGAAPPVVLSTRAEDVTVLP